MAITAHVHIVRIMRCAGFSQNLGNIKFRQIQKFDDAQLWENIKEGVDEDGSKLD